ncbi:helix-hairpin-helix domain-containing protein [Proteinivorax tanatarense]|uniref:Helix-hairpin-helix domain-containing protein n=1 Tax=Proteinivorax tanatarense TaxID=1260629 RepID=A0AAU7VII0_9FIRM
MELDKEKIIATILILTIVSVFGVVNWYRSYRNQEQPIIEKEATLDEDKDEKLDEKIIIHVTGFVNNPGVYQLNEGDRVIDAINKAGGVLEEGDKNALNLAAYVYDGEKITVPKLGEEIDQKDISASDGRGRVNINRATVEELTNLNGIGDARAEAIVQFREENGNFKSKEDIKQVAGIGPAIYDQIKDEITVR